jgi:hypothetical protein
VVSEKLGGAVGEEAVGEAEAEGFGVEGGAGNLVAERAAAVGRGQEGDEAELGGGFGRRCDVELAEGGDGSVATGFEAAEEGAFGGDGEARRRVVERGEELGEAGVVGADFQAQGPLAGGGQHAVEVEEFGVGGEKSGAGQSSAGQDDGVELPVADFAEAGVDVAANVGEEEVGTEGGELDAAAQAGGADAGAGREVGEAAAVAGDEDVARVFAPRDDGGQAQTGGGFGGEIFVAVDGEVDAAIEECGLEFAGEKADLAGGGERGVGFAVAGGGDDFQADGEAGVGAGQGVGDVA